MTIESRLAHIERVIERLAGGKDEDEDEKDDHSEEWLGLKNDYADLTHHLETVGSHWRSLVLHPSRTEAVLFAVLPVLSLAVELAQLANGNPILLSRAASSALVSWGKATVAQRLALEELFSWVDTELHSDESAIPQRLRDNLSAAMEADG